MENIISNMQNNRVGVKIVNIDQFKTVTSILEHNGIKSDGKIYSEFIREGSYIYITDANTYRVYALSYYDSFMDGNGWDIVIFSEFIDQHFGPGFKKTDLKIDIKITVPAPVQHVVMELKPEDIVEEGSILNYISLSGSAKGYSLFDKLKQAHLNKTDIFLIDHYFNVDNDNDMISKINIYKIDHIYFDFILNCMLVNVEGLSPIAIDDVYFTYEAAKSAYEDEVNLVEEV